MRAAGRDDDHCRTELHRAVVAQFPVPAITPALDSTRAEQGAGVVAASINEYTAGWRRRRWRRGHGRSRGRRRRRSRRRILQPTAAAGTDAEPAARPYPQRRPRPKRRDGRCRRGVIERHD